MNLTGWFGLGRLAVELRAIRRALEDLRDMQAAKLLSEPEPGAGVRLRSFYRGKEKEKGAEPDFLSQTDEEFARLEALENLKLRDGGAIPADWDPDGDEG